MLDDSNIYERFLLTTFRMAPMQIHRLLDCCPNWILGCDSENSSEYYFSCTNNKITPNGRHSYVQLTILLKLIITLDPLAVILDAASIKIINRKYS